MIRVVLIGGGNLATHLALAFQKNSKIELVQIYNRSLNRIENKFNSIPKTDSLESLLPADIYIISVSDSAIKAVSAKLKKLKGLVLHTSGATDCSVLTNQRTGVFYPLQSFTKNSSLDFLNIPICIESNNSTDNIVLEQFAEMLSKKVYFIDSKKRKKLHLAAVFVNNFVNHMYHIGEEICSENDIPFDVLYPIIDQTAKKIRHLSPIEAQTGPAFRKDTKTLDSHKIELNSNRLKIYTLLSEAISNIK